MGLRRAPLVAAIVSASVTAAVALLSSLRFAYANENVHVAIETSAALIAGATAFLVHGRARESGRRADAILAAALATLSLTNLWYGVFPELVYAQSPPWADWAALGGRLAGDALLVSAAIAGAGRVRWPARVLRRSLAGVVVVLAAAGTATFLCRDRLPTTLVNDVDPAGSANVLLEGHAAVLVAQAISTLLLVVAAVGFARGRAWRTTQLGAWLATAAVLGAAGRANYVLYPSVYSEWVYTGDVFRLAFYATLLLALSWQVREYWRRLEQVAVLEERRRLARDLHDGLAQELAYIARHAPELDPEQTRAAANRALAEAREAIATLARTNAEPLGTAVAAAAEEVARRAGGRVSLAIRAHDETVPPATREALVRVAREAVGNALRHGGTTTVSLSLDARPLRLVVRDRGRGFQTEAPTRGHGIVSMRERVEALGGAFSIRSAPGAGTRVEAVLP